MKYHFYTDNKHKVICTTTFAKKPIKGVAICAEGDTFDLNIGKKLAQARADYKYATKRLAYAAKKLEKMRYTAGCEFKVNKHNIVDVFYRYQDINGGDNYNDRDSHILGIGYLFKFWAIAHSSVQKK